MRKSMTHPSGAVRTASWLGMAVLLAFSAGAAAEVTFNVPVTTCGPVFRQITGKADDDKKVQQWINSGLKKLLDTDTAAKNLPNFYSSAKKTFTRLKDKNLNAKLQAKVKDLQTKVLKLKTRVRAGGFNGTNHNPVRV